MQNTSGNKEKFFALHWGQKFYTPNSEGEINHMIFLYWGVEYSKKSYLQLKSLCSIHVNDETLTPTESDFYRSKGYAVPWLGLSVDKMVEFGWIKLIVK